MKKAAIYPGTFDPFTLGHMDIAQRAIKLFDHVYISIGKNKSKEPLFTAEERKIQIENVFRNDSRVTVIIFDYLLVDLMKELGTNVIIRGLRAVSDFEMELQMASVNRVLYSSSESVFLMTSDKYSFLSSRMVKEIASMSSENLKKFVPSAVEVELYKKFRS